MFSSLALFVLFVLFACPFIGSLAFPLEKRYFPQGTITSPENGTVLMPGQTFDFLYNPRSDYCLSSYNFTVWALTSPPSGILSEDVTGHYFGRFSYSSYPTNPFPNNPAPTNLTMPDFSRSPGGFGLGSTASAVPMYLAVVEEWNSCTPTVGNQFSLTANPIIYNGTST